MERLPVVQAAKEIGCANARLFRRWARLNQIGVLQDRGMRNAYVIKEEFIAAKNLAAKMYLLSKYPGDNLADIESAYMKAQVKKASGSEPRIEDKKDVRKHLKPFVNMALISEEGSIFSMRKLKPIYLPKEMRIRGVGISTKCAFCKNKSTNDICLVTQESLSRCPHPESHFTKVVINESGTGRRRTLVLKDRSLEVILKKALLFKQRVKDGNYNIEDLTSYVEEKPKVPERSSSPLLVDSVDLYLKLFNNEIDVPVHLQERQKSAHYRREVTRAFEMLKECMTLNGHDPNTYTVDKIDDHFVGQLHAYFTEVKQFESITFNKNLGFIKRWYADYLKLNKLTTDNYFAKGKRKILKGNGDTIETITEDEFNRMLSLIVPQENTTHKNRTVYTDYLVKGFKLAALTGLRRSLTKLRFNMIHESENGGYIKAENQKMNLIENRFDDSEKKYVFIPLTTALLKFLMEEMELERYRGSNEFILAPNLQIDRDKVMPDKLTAAFTHYFNKLNTDKNCSFKTLRKNYATSLSMYAGENTNILTGHGSMATLKNYYINPRELAAKVAQSSFNVFSTAERKEEMDVIRNKNENKDKNKDLAK